MQITNRKTIAEIETQREETLVALSKFKEGDRVYNKLEKKHGLFHSPNLGQAKPSCWVRYYRFKFDEWQLDESGFPSDPMELVICKESCHCLVDQLPSVAERSPTLDLLTNLESPNSLKLTNTDEANLENSIPLSPAIETSEPSMESQDDGMRSLAEVPVRIFPEQIQAEMGLLETSQDFGGKCSELSENAAPNLSSGKMSPPLDTQHQENNIALSPMLSGVLPACGMYASGLLSAQKPLERPISENESYLLLPTPMAHSRAKDTYRPPGQDKLEQKLRELGIVPPGEITTPEFRAWMQGISGWKNTTSADGGETTHHLQELAQKLEVSPIEENKLPPLEIVVLPNRQRSLGEGSVILQELSIDEERDRQHLERKVERAFYEAGKALEEIRDRKLYRSTHKTFESYCKDRFGFKRSHSYRLIDASGVVDNLLTNGQQNEMSPNWGQILPTTENQVRDLVKLEPEEQRQIWNEAVEQSNGKVPTGAKVKGIVERMKEKTFVPLTKCAQYAIGDVVIVKAHGSVTLRPYDGYWAIVEQISDYFYHLCISVKEQKISRSSEELTQLLGCKGDEVERVEATEADKLLFKSVSDRIRKLAWRDDLATTANAMLEALSRKTCFTDDDLWFLEKIEERYGIIND